MSAIDKSASRVKEMFGQIAARYDFLNRLLSMGVDRYWRRKTVRLVAPHENAGPILDVCTGTADLALAFWRASRKRCRVVGADFCRPMLVVGNEKRKKAQSGESVTLVEADAMRLPFSDDSFQIVSVAFGLRNVAEADVGLREMVRVCQKGGKIAVLEFTTPRNWLLKRLYAAYFRHVLPRIGQALATNSQDAYNYLPATVGEFPQYEALVDRMREAGLAEVRYYPLTFGVATLYVGVK